MRYICLCFGPILLLNRVGASSKQQLKVVLQIDMIYEAQIWIPLIGKISRSSVHVQTPSQAKMYFVNATISYLYLVPMQYDKMVYSDLLWALSF